MRTWDWPDGGAALFLDDIRIPIEPRNGVECLDLAQQYVRAHALKVGALTLGFAVPFVCVAHLIASPEYRLLWQLFAVFVGTRFLTAPLVLGVGRNVFGSELRWRETYRAGRGVWLRACWHQFVGGVALLLATALLLLPGPLLAVWVGFTPEVILLERLRGRRLNRRSTEFHRGVFANLLGRWLFISSVWLLAALVVFSGVDLAATTLFDYSVFWYELLEYVEVERFELLLNDSVFTWGVAGALWLVFPLCRIAWFFCYLNVRIRKEGWDIELEFRREASAWSTPGN